MKQNNAHSYKTSYDQIPQPGNPTYTEAWALIETARRMVDPIESGSLKDADNLVKARVALRLNWRLWTIFQTELSHEEGAVPDDIRGNMLSLCNFVDKHSVATINSPTVDGIMRLVEINRQIANGLLESLQGDEDVIHDKKQKSQDTSETETSHSIDTAV